MTRMYRRILVPIDNSGHSDEATRLAAGWAERMGSTVIGFHVYAARLHEARFRQMEAGLPDRYQAPEQLQRQREVHETLISEGLRIISESYLDHAEQICRDMEVPFERRLAEGQNYVEILREIERDGYDLVSLGALGLGARRRSLIGSVSERVLRRSALDVMLARAGLSESRGVMVAIDGSPNAFKAVDTAFVLGQAMEQPVEVVSVFDPQFHIAAFRGIANVLSEEGVKLFRLDEQQKLHEEVIDKGLEKLYQGHLETAARMAEAVGQPIQTTLLKGKPFQKVLEHIGKQRPSLLIVGRYGLHRTEWADMGSTSENLARLARCNVLVVSGELGPEQRPPSQVQTSPEIRWTEHAEAGLQKVPSFARGMARQAIEGYAREHDYEEVTPEVLAKARERMGM